MLSLCLISIPPAGSQLSVAVAKPRTTALVSGASVTITNAFKLHITEKKRVQKIYTHYSQYPGGLKEESLGSLLKRKGQGHAAVLRRAIERMMPRNTLRVARMKRLTITD
jgi:large subunit ribosomal protein L13